MWCLKSGWTRKRKDPGAMRALSALLQTPIPILAGSGKISRLRRTEAEAAESRCDCRAGGRFEAVRNFVAGCDRSRRMHFFDAIVRHYKGTGRTQGFAEAQVIRFRDLSEAEKRLARVEARKLTGKNACGYRAMRDSWAARLCGEAARSTMAPCSGSGENSEKIAG